MDVLSALLFFVLHANFSQFNLVMAVTLHVINLLKDLRLGVLAFLTVGLVARFVMVKELVSVKGLRLVGNPTVLVVVE